MGLNAQIPQHEAGYLASPNKSTPKPIPDEKVAINPASPPQLPPVENSFSAGLDALPQIAFAFSLEKQESKEPAHWLTLDLKRGFAPNSNKA